VALNNTTSEPNHKILARYRDYLLSVTGVLSFKNLKQQSPSSHHPSIAFTPSRAAGIEYQHTQVHSVHQDAMNGTPRLRSAFPATPRTDPRFSAFNPRQSYPTPSSQASSARPSPNVKGPAPAQQVAASQTPNKTLVPLDVIDAPTQRLYVVSFYLALTAWRLYNYWNISDDLDSTWLFLKWIGIDAAFFVGLPAFRIPWLEWSFATTLAIWLTHAVVNAFLMYQIPIPLGAWIGAVLKLMYDRELAISEHRVKPGDILQNSSIILGKQIIQILPEGSAFFNPEKEAFCLDLTTTAVELPIQINQTAPMLIELLRTDLDTEEQETITITAKQARQLKRQADKGHHKSDTASPRTLRYSTSKKGMYQLVRVVDETKLEVRGRSVDTMVVSCPQASLSTGAEDKCTGDLSGVALQVSGTPPFRVKYSKQINKQQSSSIVENVSPPDLESPMASGTSDILTDPRRPNLDWARPSTYTVDINESLHQNGSWLYTVEEVQDGLGNKVKYSEDNPKAVSKPTARRIQHLTVHHRPKVYLAGCDAEHFLRVAKDDSTSLPVRFRPVDQLASQDWPLTLKYTFAAEASAPGTELYEEAHTMSNERTLPRVSMAGKYDLKSIESQFCAGEINEPSSCLLYNPPEPDLGITSDDIIDKCAGNPIGMNVNLDFTGTPPFKVRYTVTHRGIARPKVQEFRTLRGQMEFKEQSAGSYIYNFLDVEDAVYGSRSLKGRDLVLEQTIKPPASAAFAQGPSIIKACLGQPVSFDVNLSGEGPWDLDYEVVHGGKRKKETVHSESSVFSILPSMLREGGKQTIILTGVQDKSKCKTSIREERAVDVRPEQPQAAFGDLDGKRSISALEGKAVKLPLRLKGLAPWSVRISNLDRPSEPAAEYYLRDANAIVSVDQPGTYEIQSVHDTCPGQVDASAKIFRVSWVQRPTLVVRDTSVMSNGKNIFRKPAVCEGDEDSFGLTFTGRPPYQVKYQQKVEPLKGSSSISHKQMTAAIGSASIHMDTTKAGEYTYTFNELGDSSYGFDKRHFQSVHVQQQVYPLPSAKFSHPGKTYGHCKDEINDTENIPISFEGVPPFTVEIGVSHHGSARPEIIRQKDILSNQYSWTYSRSGLDLGTHVVNLRSVTDSRGCEKTIDHDTSSVRIMVSDPPAIIPLESHTDFCVGERVSYSLSGQPPFDVFYKFQGKDRKASSSGTTFRRIAEQPGDFTITAISDNASGKCKASKAITKIIHPMPSVKISKGKTAIADIHEGGEVEILFEFTGTPPFEFT
jgi:nucleoporin POM152